MLFAGAAEAEHFAQQRVGGFEVFVLGFDAFEEAFGVGAAFGTGRLTRRSAGVSARSTKLSRKSSYMGNDSMFPPELLP